MGNNKSGPASSIPDPDPINQGVIRIIGDAALIEETFVALETRSRDWKRVGPILRSPNSRLIPDAALWRIFEIGLLMGTNSLLNHSTLPPSECIDQVDWKLLYQKQIISDSLCDDIISHSQSHDTNEELVVLFRSARGYDLASGLHALDFTLTGLIAARERYVEKLKQQEETSERAYLLRAVKNLPLEDISVLHFYSSVPTEPDYDTLCVTGARVLLPSGRSVQLAQLARDPLHPERQMKVVSAQFQVMSVKQLMKWNIERVLQRSCDM